MAAPQVADSRVVVLGFVPGDGLPGVSPLAIPIFGSAGVLSFLEPERGLIALLSIVLLMVTLGLRLRAEQHCRLAQQPSQDRAGG